MSFRDLSPEDAQRALAGDPTLRILDVRTEPEHRSHHLPGATLIPIQELEQRIDELDPAENWLVLCEHGRRSVYACHFLVQMGFTQLTNLRGGIAHWMDCGLPVER